MSRPRRSLVCFALPALAATVFGVGAAPSTPGPGVVTTVLVTARDFSFTLSRGSVPVGTTRFVVTNAGVLAHDFAIAGEKTRLLGPGERATIVVRFHKASRFTYRRSDRDQAELGMRGVLVVGKSKPGRSGRPSRPRPATLYVAQRGQSCSNGGSGTAVHPFCTIAPAASRLRAGQTVLVRSGTYKETVRVSRSGTRSAPINFVAAPGGKVSVTGAGNSRSVGFYVSGRNYVTIHGFNVSRTGADGIVVRNSSNVVIRGNRVSYAGRPAEGRLATGIRLKGATDSIVAGNTVDHNTNYGIYLQNGSTRNRIVGNRVSRNARVIERAAAGIALFSSPGNTVCGNISHANEDSGIGFLRGSNNSLACDNVLYNNGDHGIDSYRSTGQLIIANTVYKNTTAGINVEAGSTGATIANNISVDNGIGSPRSHGDIRVESGSTFATTMDYDLVYRNAKDTLLVWNSVSYSSLAAFKLATGQEAHGLQQNPKFSDAVGANLHLAADSPAIDSANSGVTGQPKTDVEGNPRFDEPAVPNTGAGPRTYDERGAYEFSGASASQARQDSGKSKTVSRDRTLTKPAGRRTSEVSTR
jgi:parallel beta-helix repeat protein